MPPNIIKPLITGHVITNLAVAFGILFSTALALEAATRYSSKEPIRIEREQRV